jgi:hypothetical protein
VSNTLWRTLVVTHRYLGVAVGLLMVVWFASGAVMMYVGMPRLSEAMRLSALSPIAWQAWVRTADGLIDDNQPFGRAQVENLAETPVLRLRRTLMPDVMVDLARDVVTEIDEAAAHAIADRAQRRFGQAASVVAVDAIESDQWTVGRYRADRPLFRFTYDDPEGSTIYVSSAAGRVLLRTTATERFWNWLGTVPHWIYLAALRSNVALWSQIVIWASILGTFLTVVGLYLGIAQFKRGRDGALSPYRGLFYWHHLAGLVFGVVMLTFVVSGLLSMNPWGLLESRQGAEQTRLEGPALRWRAIRPSLDAVRARQVQAVSLSTAPLAGQLYWLATDATGTVTRLDAAGNLAPLTETDLAQTAQRLAGPSGIAEQGVLSEEDAYYYKHHNDVVLPVYRVILNDDENTRYYLDPVSGALLERADANRRWHRWLFAGLHRLDFSAGLRARPVWDIVVLTLLFGGIAVSATGVYLALRRIRSDLRSLSRFLGSFGRKPAAQPAVGRD